MSEIREAAVIGAGVMGSAIAAQLADADIQVTLLDLDPSIAAAGVAGQLKSGAFLKATSATRIRTGSTVTDLGLLARADWIIESAAENLDVKRRIFGAIDVLRKSGSIVSSNTSTILLATLTQGMGARFAADFLITHFFNPPRWMRLLELIAGSATRPDAVGLIADFAGHRLGKTVVFCKDTPGFIANRIGTFWLAAAIHEAVALQLDVEDVDAMIRGPFGIPSGIFALADLIGIDLLPPAWRSLQSALPPDDPLQAYPAEPPLITRLIAQGRYGRKTGAGFMRRRPDGTFDVLDLNTGEYRPLRSGSAAATHGDLIALMSHASPVGRFAARLFGRTLAYAASLVPEIADSPDLIDRAMRDGYGWKQGPFELIDRMGARGLANCLVGQGIPVPRLLREAASGNAFYHGTQSDRSV